MIIADGYHGISLYEKEVHPHGFQMLQFRIAGHLCSDDSMIISFESMTRYDDNLVRYLIACIYNVCVLNLIKPSVTHKNSIRRTKTYKVNTFIIAQIELLDNQLNSKEAEMTKIIKLYD